MRRGRIMAGVLAVLVCGSPAALSAAEENGSEPELVLQYDFYDVRDGVVADGSIHAHDGRIVGGVIVPGRRKPALELMGEGQLTTEALGRDGAVGAGAMTIGAMCRPAAPDGVLLSMGDSADGFRLSLRGGVPVFEVWTNGVLREAAASEPVSLGEWVHVAGVIGEKGGLSVLVNAWEAGATHDVSFLARTPPGPFAVGADAKGVAGRPAWRGAIEDVRVYRSAISRETHRELLGDWANRPGCGCRK